jgi:hypothetical protein
MSELIELGKYPQFAKDKQGKSSAVILETIDYIKLLIKANITNKVFWPPDMEEGADVLLRLRQIESDCIDKYGEFDWEKLPLEIQDEYDHLFILLDELLNVGENMDLEEYKI